MLIQVEQLTKDYTSYSLKGRQAFRALDNVSLNIQAGSIFGLLGQNGAGKTTLIKLLMGLAYKKSGNILIFGKEPDTDIRKRIGYLPENPSFPAHLNGGDILQLYGKLSGLTGSVLEKKIQDTTAMLAINDALNKVVTAYSKGMKQRLGLAQAMLHDPELLILDEPTDGVDPLGRKSIREVLTFLKEAGKTIFINSHILSEVEMISDRVAILGKGKLLQEGSVAAMVRSDIEYSILLENSLERLDDALSAEFPELKLANPITLECQIKDSGELNRLLSRLIALNYTILEVHRKKVNLEDVYVKLMQESIK
ncbi:MAG: ABC transporter ATP-binding protein [Ignavibacteriales bacterium]|nr:ABC transporter ATP-binding protein [Ignavibacteriales bacterium]